MKLNPEALFLMAVPVIRAGETGFVQSLPAALNLTY